MTINSAIITALSSLSVPAVPNEYTGEATEYITFNYNSRGEDFGDDEPGHELYSVQVHYFCPRTTNSLATRQAIKNLLLAADFTWPNVTDATDADGQHWVFEADYLAGAE